MGRFILKPTMLKLVFFILLQGACTLNYDKFGQYFALNILEISKFSLALMTATGGIVLFIFPIFF